VIVEGDSEELFVRDVLAPHLGERGVDATAEKIKKPGEKGGYTSYRRLQQHVRQRLLADARVFVTTMIDLYGTTRHGDFPGLSDAPEPNAPYERVRHLEAAFRNDIKDAAGDDRRFIPYLQLHEFEALVLVDPKQLDWMYIEADDAAPIAALCANIENLEPERINEDPEKAPSKRLERFFKMYQRRYDKKVAASVVVAKIGLEKLKARCPHFRAWVERLEALGAPSSVPTG
jgi:hypothetical protein